MPLDFGTVSALIQALMNVRDRVAYLEQQETYSGIINLNGYTLTVTGDASLSGTPAAVGHTHAGTDITSALIAAARLGSGAGAATVLHGDQTFSAVSLTAEVTGTLPIGSGGTGATSASAALSNLGGVGASHSHAGTDITSALIAAARLGTGASATTVLHGDQTFSAVDIVAETTGTLSIARGGTGATSASAALSALGGASTSHTHAAADITSGTMATARLGSGTASASTLLFGDSTWAALVAADIPNLDASKITAGTIATARLGSGTANSSSYLRGDQTWATVSAGVTGSGATNQIAYWSSSSAIAGDTGLTWDATNNDLTATGDMVAASFRLGVDTAVSRSSNVLVIGGDSTFTGTQIQATGATRLNCVSGNVTCYADFISDTGGGNNLGSATQYWNDVSYKTLTDRGCLGWYDEGVELQDGRIVSDVEALKAIQPHPYLQTPAGQRRLDYTTLPKHVYRPVEILREPMYHDDGTVWYRAGEAAGEDGAETTALISIVIGAIKELSGRIDTLEGA